jgi:hypothetical protein
MCVPSLYAYDSGWLVGRGHGHGLILGGYVVVISNDVIGVLLEGKYDDFVVNRGRNHRNEERRTKNEPLRRAIRCCSC